MYEWIAAILAVYFAVLGVFIFLLFSPFRSGFYRDLVLKKESETTLRFCNNYERSIHFMVIGRQILLFFLPLGVALLIFGVGATMEQLTSLFVLGLSIEVFWIAYLPTLTTARLYIDFFVDNLTDPKTQIELTANTEHAIYARIYNLGFSTLKNSVVLIYFGEGFDIIPHSDKKYKQLDFSKHFTVQKANSGVAFMPTHDNYQSFPPQEWFLFPVIVKTKSQVSPKIEIQVYSENSWGITKYWGLTRLINKNAKEEAIGKAPITHAYS